MSKIAKFFTTSLFLLLSVSAFGQVIRISQEPATNSIGPSDDFLLNKWNGSGYDTRRINAGSLVSALASNTAANSLAAQISTNPILAPAPSLSNTNGDFVLGAGSSRLQAVPKATALNALEPTSPGFWHKRFPLAMASSTTNIKVLSFGDSMAVLGSDPSPANSILTALIARYGFDGYALGNWLNMKVTTLGGGASTVSPDANSWCTYYSLPAAGTVNWTNINISDGGLRSAQGGIFYLTGPSEGSFSVQVSTNGAAFATRLTVNASGSARIAYTNFALSTQDRCKVQVLGASGTCHIIGPTMAVGTDGVLVQELASGGNNLTALQSLPQASIDCLLTNLNPDVILYCMKELPDYGSPAASQVGTLNSNITWLESTFARDCPNADVIYLGPPSDSRDTNAATAFNAVENDALAALAFTNNRTFINLARVWTYPSALRYGLMLDNVHPNAAGAQLLGTYAWNELIGSEPGPPVHYSMATSPDGTMQSHVTIGYDFPLGSRFGGDAKAKFAINDVQRGVAYGELLFGAVGLGTAGIAFARNSANALDILTSAIVGNDTDTFIQSPKAAGTIQFMNRNNGSLPNGKMGGWSTNGGFYVGNMNGLGGFVNNVPRGTVMADSDVIAGGTFMTGRGAAIVPYSDVFRLGAADYKNSSWSAAFDGGFGGPWLPAMVMNPGYSGNANVVNMIPWGRGWTNIVVQVLARSGNSVNQPILFYSSTSTAAHPDDTSGTSQFTVVSTNTTLLTQTNYFADDSGARYLKLAFYKSDAYDAMTNQFFIEAAQVFGY